MEVEVPKELSDYEVKWIGHFTARQILFGLITVIIGILVFIAGRMFLPINILGTVVIIMVLPALFLGFIKPMGMNPEQYIVLVYKFYKNSNKPIMYINNSEGGKKGVVGFAKEKASSYRFRKELRNEQRESSKES